MLRDCARWSVQAASFRLGLSTPTALVLWRVYIEPEEAMVAETVLRLVGEMGDRLFDRHEDATPACSGEQAAATH
jgi:hypothetical protein